VRLRAFVVAAALVVGWFPATAATATAPTRVLLPVLRPVASPPVAGSAVSRVSLTIKGFSGSHFTADLGEHVHLIAKAGQLSGGQHLAVDDVTGKTKNLRTCTRGRCSRSESFDTSGKHDFEAFLTDASGIVARSNVVTVKWANLTLSLIPSDSYGTFNQTSDTQLAGVAVTLAAATGGAVGSLWDRIAIVDESGAVLNRCQVGTPCRYHAIAYAGTRSSPVQPVTHDYRAVALDASGNTVAQSVPLQITWRPWVVTLTGGGTLASTAKGLLVVQVEHAVTAPNLTLVVVDLSGTAGDSFTCPNTECDFQVGPKSGTHVYEAIVVNPATDDVAGASSTVAYQWCAAGAPSGNCDSSRPTLTADHDQVPVGGTVNLTADSGSSLAGTGEHIVITDDNGARHDCPAEADSCIWSVKETAAVTRHYTASIEQADGTKVGSDSNTVQVEWVVTWTGTISISVDNNLTNPPVGVKPTIRAIVSGTSLSGTGYTIHITSSAGGSWSCADTVDNCYVSTETSLTVGTARTYHAYVADQQGAHAADSSSDVTITWGAWPVTLQLDPVDVPVPYNGSTFNPSIPFGADFRIVADTGNFDVSGTGLHIAIKVVGSSAAPVTSAVSPAYADVPGYDQPEDVTFEAYVADGSDNPLPSNATMVVAFTPWNVRGYWDQQTVADNYTVPGDTDATLTATSDYEIAGTGYQMAIWGASQSQPDKTCQQTTGCAEPYLGQAGDEITPQVAIYSPSNKLLESFTAEKVVWGSGGGGGGGSLSMSADTDSPAAGDSATLTVTSTGPLESGYQVKIEDPYNGYVYNTCSSSDVTGDACTLTVPFLDFGGHTGCPDQGVAGQSCSYEAYEVPLGDSNAADAIDSSGVVTITWQ